MFLFRKFVTNNPKTPKNKNQKYKLDVKIYDSTYEIPLRALRRIGLRLVTNDSPGVRMFWDSFFWVDFYLLVVVAWLEFHYMVETALGGSARHAFEVFTMMPCFGCVLLALSKSYKMARNRRVFENLVRELRTLWPNRELSEEEHGIMKTALKRLKFTVLGYYWCNNALLAFYLCRPFIGVIKRALGYYVPLTLPFFYWLPFDAFQPGAYEALLISQTWHAMVVIWCMFSGDVVFCIFLCHITSYFDLLSIRIRDLIQVPVDEQLIKQYPLAKAKKYSINADQKELEEVYERALKEIILRHQDLIRTIRKAGLHSHIKSVTYIQVGFDNSRDRGQPGSQNWKESLSLSARLSGDVEDIFSFPLLMNFFNSSIIICFCGFCCVIVEKWNEIVYKVFLATALSQTWLICWYGNRLFDSSKAVSDALYNSGWYNSTNRIKNYLLIMICRSQKNVRVTTYGFSTVCLETFTTILKSSWSYFTLLLHFYKK